MKTKYKLFFNLMIILGICFSLFGSTIPVKAATCTWNGLNGSWAFVDSWDNCEGMLPGATDNVVIPPDTANDPIIYSGSTINVASIEIQSGAQLTVMGTTDVTSQVWDNSGTIIVSTINSLHFNGSGTFENNGTITKIGNGILSIYPEFNNYGTVDIQDGQVILYGGSNNLTGLFIGGGDLVLTTEGEIQTYNFEVGSYVSVNNFRVSSANVNFSGTYDPSSSGSKLNIQTSTFTFESIADAGVLAETVELYGNLTLGEQVDGYTISKLTMDQNSELINPGELTINNQFNWFGGTISGAGTTTVNDGASFNIDESSTSVTYQHTLNEQKLVNLTIANWGTGKINLYNGSILQNDNTFNALEPTKEMGGALISSFVNNGSFTLNGTTTTTYINVDFVNSGSVEVISGTLVFYKGITCGDGTTVDLSGGTVNIWTGYSMTLNPGAILVGSGPLNGDLNNGGEVSPGTSPGLITITGDYTQTASGSLTIEIGGITPETEYDQLIITDSAILAGTLDVNLYADFVPSLGESFTILTYGSHTGAFGIENLPLLPVGLEWEIEYGDTEVILTVREATTMFVFLPMVIR